MAMYRCYIYRLLVALITLANRFARNKTVTKFTMERGKGGKLKKLILPIDPFQHHISIFRGKGAKLIKCAIKNISIKRSKAQ